MSASILSAHRAEFARAVSNHKYDVSPDGVLFPAMGLSIAGHFESWLNGADHQVDPNVIPTEGLNHILSVIVAGGTQVNPWYVALFSANVTPQATWTAANYTANSTEFTNYVEANRVTYIEGTPAAGAVDNAASMATFTMSGSATIYGGALISAQAKSAITGTLLAAARFSAGRSVIAADVLQVKYTLSATSI